MAWVALEHRFNRPDGSNSLPTIIAGPILRRVEADYVTVWVALSRAMQVTLRVYSVQPGDYDGRGDRSHGRSPADLFGERSSIRLGKRLHVACVVARTPDGIVTTLQPGRLYCYDLELNDPGNAPEGEYRNNLNSFGLLKTIADGGTSKALGYEEGMLPRFALPPDNLRELRIFYGSCRKPHAPGFDALDALDGVIETTKDDPVNRPHQLFLTGDQIYADDVAAPLLKELTSAGKYLLGWLETLPGVNMPVDDLSLGPTQRQKVINDIAKFTSTDASSHLMSLGEFYAMYLYAWSPELWPPLLPDERSVLGFQIVDEYEKDVLGHILPFIKARHEDVVKQVRAEAKNLTAFRASLPAVRRVLANVPTYMMFDDHEVTDDWLLNGEWAKAALDPGNELGRRILVNALAAFSIFQAWGNTPAAFESGPAKKLLTAISEIRNTDPTRLNQIAPLVGVVHWGEEQPADRVVFDFAVTWSKHRAILLDTRTRRAFPGPNKSPAELLSATATTDQVSHRLSPAPDIDVNIVVSPAPVLGYRLMEDYVQPLMVELGAVFTADAEAWKLNEMAFQRLLRALSAGSRVVVLSGDVHYGFSVACDFWEDTQGWKAVIAQFTSSAFKNESGKLPSSTYLLHELGYKVVPRTQITLFGWDNAARNLRVVKTSPPAPSHNPMPAPLFEYKISRDMAMLEESPYLLSVSRPPDWTARIRYLRETRKPHPNRNPALAPPVESLPASAAPPEVLSTYVAVGRYHRELLNGSAGRDIVGYNNLGEVTFSEVPLVAFHRLWWRLPDQAPEPLTQHEVSLDSVGVQPTIPIG